MLCRYLFVCLVGLSFAADSAKLSAAFLVPSVSSDYFGWERGDTNSTYSGWDFLEDATIPSASGGYTDSTPDLGQFGTPGSLTVGAGGIAVGSGNAYSPFVALQFHANAPSGTAAANTRIVAQFRTQGSELNYGGIMLSLDPNTAGTIAPTLAIELDRTPLGGELGSEVDYLALWDLDSSHPEVRIDFGGAESSVSLHVFQFDSFTQDSEFQSPNAVPEPGSLLACGLLGCGWISRRRRR